MRAFEFITEGNDREFHTGGSLGLPFPGTYEQEFNKFKTRGSRRITAMTNEALDSSYEYTSGQKPGIFYFKTDDGTEYKVEFGKSGRTAELSFYARGHGDEHKVGLTGTGNASKIFGTIVNIAKEYITNNNIMTLLFNATNSEPSRVRLYNTLASKISKVLPDYSYMGATKNGNFTKFTIKHKNAFHSPVLDKANQVKSKALDAVFEYDDTADMIPKVNEALDSSYEYEGNPIFGKFKFTTEDGVLYKVYFQGNGLVEVAFSAILSGEENKFRPDKTTLTGTGNSRKVFGTVIKIVKEYLEFHRPNALYFTGEKDEPSRIKLYDRLISQVDKELPEYVATKTIDLGSGKAYMLTRKDSIAS